MKLVVDASVMVAALINDNALGSWAATLISGEDLLAPDILPYEVVQVLRNQVRGGRLAGAQAGEVFDLLKTSEVVLIPFDDLADRVWQLRHNYSSYDASYVAAAELLDVPLATLDLKMASQSVDCDFLTPP